MDNWYLIQFKPNSHRLAERNLNSQGFVTFLPMQLITKKKVSRFVSSLKPLFPGYMFIKVKSDIAPWRRINNTIGVSKLVSFEGKPKALPPRIVSGLMLRCDASGIVLPPKNLSKGDRVELLNGPFSSFITTVDTIDPKQRIWVIMNFMGQRSRMKVTADQLYALK